MKLNEKLHLVVPVYGADDRVTCYVHSAPMSRESFEASFFLLAKTFSAIHGEGLSEIAGPRVSKLVLMRIAKSRHEEEEAAAIMNEIRRLTNVVARDPAGTAGWATVPYEEAVARKMIDADDLSEVENAIVFFTVESAMLQKRVLIELLPGAVKLWGASTSSSDFTELVASLRTSSGTVSTGETLTPLPGATPGSLVAY